MENQERISQIAMKLISCAENKTLPQTILFYSSSLQNIDSLIFSFAKKLINPKRVIEDQRFKDICLTGQFPDFINVEKGLSGTVKIDDIHYVESLIQYAPYESENRIVYFRDAAAMTEQSQNAILKKIEEPPKRTFFFLAVNKRNSLLPTILSRSVSIFVPGANTESDFSELLDCFPFLSDLVSDLGEDLFVSEKNKFTMFCSDINFDSLINIKKIYNEISDYSAFDSLLSSVAAEKSKYLKQMIVRMRLAFIAFCVREKNPEVAEKITKFLVNQQYFSIDASLFCSI